MSPEILLKLMPFESVTSSLRAEPITHMFISLVIRISIFIREGIRIIPDSRCYSSDLLPKSQLDKLNSTILILTGCPPPHAL